MNYAIAGRGADKFYTGQQNSISANGSEESPQNVAPLTQSEQGSRTLFAQFYVKNTAARLGRRSD